MRTLLAMLLTCCSLTLIAQQRSAVWCPDSGDGTYVNPVLFADYSDPDVCAVGEDYYLTASSFQCVPGLPVLHSRDLVSWHIVGHALQELLPREVFDAPAHGCGVWAPSIRHHDGRFYIYWGDPDRGIFVVTSERADSGWSEPVCVLSGRGMIDPCPLWDDDGRCYLVHAWAASRSGINSVLTVRELSADGLRAVGQPSLVFDGGQVNHTTEGPKFYRHDGYYWIMCPAGGVAMGWQLAMRSRSPYGPYEWRVVMAQGTTAVNGPHQGAWVRTPMGEDWFLHFNDRGPIGRVVYLQPMAWHEGWPVIGEDADGDGCGQPVERFRKPAVGHCLPPFTPQDSDEFNTPHLGLQWQWHANYNPLFGMPTADGHLRLYTCEAATSLWQVPNLLLQKLPADRFTATARVRFAAKAADQWGGMVMMGRDYAAIVVRSTEQDFVLQRTTCIGADQGGTEQLETLATLPPTARDTIPYSPARYIDLYLRMSVVDGMARLTYSTDGRRYHHAGKPFRLKEGKWIGAKMGFVALRQQPEGNRGWLDVDWFRLE